MKTQDLLILGAVALAGYLIFKRLNYEDTMQGGGGGDLGGGGSTNGGIIPFSPTLPSAPSGYMTPTKYTVLQTKPTATTVSLVGGRTYTTQRSGQSTYEGLITVGTPVQQIQQFHTAPKIVNKRKVM